MSPQNKLNKPLQNKIVVLFSFLLLALLFVFTCYAILQTKDHKKTLANKTENFSKPTAPYVKSRNFYKPLTTLSSGQNINHNRNPSDNLKKEKITALLTEKNEIMRQVLVNRDLEGLEDLINTLKKEELTQLQYEKPLLAAAANCLKYQDNEAKEEAELELKKNGGSLIRKLVRKICTLDTTLVLH